MNSERPPGGSLSGFPRCLRADPLDQAPLCSKRRGRPAGRTPARWRRRWRVGRHPRPAPAAVGRGEEALSSRRVDHARARRVAREGEQRPARHHGGQPVTRRLPRRSAVHRAVDLSWPRPSARGVVECAAAARGELLRARRGDVDRRRQARPRNGPGRASVQAPARDSVGERVHGARLVRVDDDRVDCGGELPAEDPDRRLPRRRMPGRAAVAGGEEAAAEIEPERRVMTAA